MSDGRCNKARVENLFDLVDEYKIKSERRAHVVAINETWNKILMDDRAKKKVKKEELLNLIIEYEAQMYNLYRYKRTTKSCK